MTCRFHGCCFAFFLAQSNHDVLQIPRGKRFSSEDLRQQNEHQLSWTRSWFSTDSHFDRAVEWFSEVGSVSFRGGHHESLHVTTSKAIRTIFCRVEFFPWCKDYLVRQRHFTCHLRTQVYRTGCDCERNKRVHRHHASQQIFLYIRFKFRPSITGTIQVSG